MTWIAKCTAHASDQIYCKIVHDAQIVIIPSTNLSSKSVISTFYTSILAQNNY